MAHPRKLIRHAVVAQLTNATAAGDRVQPTRVEPHRKRNLPAISVYTMHEPVDDASSKTSPRELTREPRVEIAAWVVHSEALPVDDAMDDLAEQIEAAMDADRFIGGAAGGSVLEETVMQVVDEDENGRPIDPILGIVTLTYAVTYRTTPATGPLDEFRRANVTTQIPGVGADNAVHDQFDLQQETP